MKLNKKLITTAAVLFLAVFTTLGAQTIEEWSGFGTITVSAAANLGFAPFNTWVIEISSDESDNVDGTWSDRAGHTGSIYGTVEYWLDGDGSGTWDCDQHNDTGTWYGNFGRDGVGDTCYCQWYYWGGFGGGFQGTRTQ